MSICNAILAQFRPVSRCDAGRNAYTKRNHSIDVLKFLCAVFVVFIHTEWKYKDLLQPIIRCAVPCFLIISGFFLFDKDGIKPERLKRNLIRLTKITLWATLFFIVWKESIAFITKGTLFIPSMKAFANWVLLNENPFAFHLWYLFAYLYTLLIIKVVNKYNKWKVLYFVTPALLLVDLAFGSYSRLLWDRVPSYFYVRNFLFVALPYFAIGTMVKRWTNSRDISSYKGMIIGCTILFTIAAYLERNTLVSLGMFTPREHYLTTTLLSVSMFILALSINNTRKSVLSTLGEKDSLHIYVFHPVFISCFGLLFGKLQLYETYLYFSSFLVLLATIVSIKFVRIKKNTTFTHGFTKSRQKQHTH